MEFIIYFIIVFGIMYFCSWIMRTVRNNRKKELELIESLTVKETLYSPKKELTIKEEIDALEGGWELPGFDQDKSTSSNSDFLKS